MARVTVEGCIDKLPNRFELVLLAAHRTQSLASGSHITVSRENEKIAVIALCEIMQRPKPPVMSEGLIHLMQHNAEGDEPGSTVALRLPHEHRTLAVRDDPSTDTVIDALAEEALLRGWRN